MCKALSAKRGVQLWTTSVTVQRKSQGAWPSFPLGPPAGPTPTSEKQRFGHPQKTPQQGSGKKICRSGWEAINEDLAGLQCGVGSVLGTRRYRVCGEVRLVPKSTKAWLAAAASCVAKRTFTKSCSTLALFARGNTWNRNCATAVLTGNARIGWLVTVNDLLS